MTNGENLLEYPRTNLLSFTPLCSQLLMPVHTTREETHCWSPAAASSEQNLYGDVMNKNKQTNK